MLQPSLRSALAYCVHQTRLRDTNAYTWVIQLPKELRAPIIALRAFNVELGQVLDNVSQETLLRIRMQWWRDAIKSAYSERPQPHPVILALKQTVASVQRTQSHLLRMISTMEADFLRPNPPPCLDAVEDYAEGSSSQLLYLQGRVASVDSQHYDHAASHLGKAVGITNLLRGTAFHAARRRIFLPIDICTEERVSQEDITQAKTNPGIANVAFKVATRAKGHLDQARAMSLQLPAHAQPLMMPAVAAGLYLEALERLDFDVFAPQLQRGGGFSPLWYQLLIKYNLLRNTY